MKRSSALILLLTMLLSLSACGGDVESPAAAATNTAEPTSTQEPAPTDTPEPTPTLIPTDTVAPPTATATATPEPTTPPEPATSDLIDEQEAILILAPSNISRVTSPVTVRGEADPTFEQTLAVRIVTIDGEELLTQPAMIAADLGERGSFEIELPFQTEGSFSIDEETRAWIQVFATSARDGGITHLSSVAVTLLPEGPADIAEATPQPERIVIDTPSTGETVQGGALQVSGRGLASFEQTLIVELLDESGEVMIMEPIIVNAPDLGQPGTFEIELPYSVEDSMPARLQVRDPSPAFGGDVHLSSVEISLEP